MADLLAPHAPPSTSETLLAAVQLADSFFPSGRYTLSHGLESFVQAGVVRSPDDLAALVEDYLRAVAGTSDAVAAAWCASALSSGDLAGIVGADWRLSSIKLAHEAVVASRRTGRRLLQLGRSLTDHPTLHGYAFEADAGLAPGNYAVALGCLAGAWALSPEQAALVELYSLASGLLGAALRMIRLDHTRAQVILHRLKPLIAEVAAAAAQAHYEDMSAFAPAIDIAQMAHERAGTRLFTS